MKILDSYKNRYFVEQTLPNATIYEVYDLYNKVCSVKNFQEAVKCWSTLVANVG